MAASIKVSDCYGPIPYSKVTGSEYTVAYDSMEELYIAMFKDLTAAIETLKGAVAANADFSSLKDFDYIYQGDFNKWVKYANSLKLRMAIRIANAPMTKGDANLAQKMAEEAVSDATGVMTTVGDAAYSTFSDGMNPFTVRNIPGITVVNLEQVPISLLIWRGIMTRAKLSILIKIAEAATEVCAMV